MKPHVVFIGVCVLQLMTSGDEVSLQMHDIYPWPQKEISCSKGLIHIIQIQKTGQLLQTPALTDEEIVKQYSLCNCKRRCIPETIETRWRYWNLSILYNCSDTCIICEGHTAYISCSGIPNTTLDITSANYGRTSDEVCWHPSPTIHSNNSQCQAFGETVGKVKARCQEKEECELHANDEHFSDVCPDTYKYLEIQFGCLNYENPLTTTTTTTTTTASATKSSSISTKTPLTMSSERTTNRITTSATTTFTSSTTSTITAYVTTFRTSSDTKGATTSVSKTTQVVTQTPNITNPSFMTLSSTNVSISSNTKGRDTPQIFDSDDKEGESAVTVVAVVIPIVIIVGAVVIFIMLHRRWKRKGNDEAVYKNGAITTSKGQGDGFTNVIYSKESDDVILGDNRQLSVDTYSNSSDTGYTDMHNEDTREAENNHYHVITDRIETNFVEKADDQYYAIKDKVSSEYNIIAFKPKVIPDDSNYGLTLSHGIEKVTDETYDHAESRGTLLQTRSRENVNEYSYLNERQPKIPCGENHTAVADMHRGIPKTKETGDDNLTGHDYFVLEQGGNELPADSTDAAAHDFFVLEKGQSKEIDQGTTTVTDADCHDYFVLSKEEFAGNANGNNSESKPKYFGTGLKHDTHNGTQNDVYDHTYFENPLSTEFEDDKHQYQRIDQRSSNIESENTNHDYFILEKENV